MTIQDEIREHLGVYKPNAVFRYGRNFDTSLNSAIELIEEWFVHLDPVTYEGFLNDTENTRLVIGILKQDSPDSNYNKDDNLEIDDSIETIQEDAKTFARNWINDFLDNYPYSAINYTIAPLTRVKNVMSGVLLTVTLNGKPRC